MKKRRYKKKAELGINEALLNKDAFDSSIANSQNKIREDQLQKQGIESSLSQGISKISPMGNIATAGSLAGDALSQSAIKKSGDIQKGKYAAGKAVKYGSMGASLGSFDPTGTTSAILGTAGVIGGAISGFAESGKMERRFKNLKSAQENIDNQFRLGQSVKDRVQANQAKDGKKKIFIKPENRGKFTKTKKATGKTTEELTHSKNPLTRKRAIFAQNAKKWKKKK